MSSRIVMAVVLLSLVLAASRAEAQPAFPKGEVAKYTFDKSKIFPGTVRDYWVYVPKQYDPAKPACVHVNQDGIQFNAPAVLDELFHKKEMPVTIGVFIMPGVVKAPNDKALDRINRSFEYDSLGDNYVRFLLDELLPDVETRKTADGRPIKLSKSGNDRSIGGASSGAICAFTAAWERPDAFSRVFSAIGTYVGLRGGNNYPTLIRKYEPKPIRVFLQDGSNDLDTFGGDWWLANQEMQRALKFAGYEVNHEWGDGGHDTKHATKIFPEAMKWLWKDWPSPVKAGAGSKEMKEILKEGEGWKLVAEGMGYAFGVAPNAKGEVQFFDVAKNKAYLVGLDGKLNSVDAGEEKWVMGRSGPDGSQFKLTLDHKLFVCKGPPPHEVFAKMLPAMDFIVLNNGRVFTCTPSTIDQLDGIGSILSASPKGEISLEDSSSHFYPTGVTASPDQTVLYVCDFRTKWIHCYQIKADGKLAHKQTFCDLLIPDHHRMSIATTMCVDRDGRLYVATGIGVQVCDQLGRVTCIIPKPLSETPGRICFGGANFDTLFITYSDKIYSRKLKTRGANAFEPPIKPKQPLP